MFQLKIGFLHYMLIYINVNVSIYQWFRNI